MSTPEPVKVTKAQDLKTNHGQTVSLRVHKGFAPTHHASRRA